MNLYKDYCYQDISTVVDLIKSDPVLGDGSIISGVSSSGDTISFLKNGIPVSFDLPICTEIGYRAGISFSDSQELAWQVVAVLIIAWSIKIWKRGM